MSKYTLGLDFGTQSARALIVQVGTGRETAAVSMDYAHGVMEEALPDGTPLPPDWALQHPADYLECLWSIIPRAIEEAKADPAQIVGVGVDATSCTLIPVDAQGTPLCLLPGFAGEKHAYPKLWKHHAAQMQADRMTSLAEARGEAFLGDYGGRISSESAFPKIWQVLEEAPDVYARAAGFIELGDWLVFQLTGSMARSSCLAGCKALWSRSSGYPDEGYFRALDPRLEHVVEEKLSNDIRTVCSRAGCVTRQAASRTGLRAGTAVAVAMADGQVALPAAGIREPGRMLMIIGTSSVYLIQGESHGIVPGICCVRDDVVYPGVPVYEAGQCCAGDHFDWFIRSLCPPGYTEEARARGTDPHSLLTQRASELKPGESGLLALDWWNGNRSVLMDSDLTGLILGLTLSTKPEEIYRTLIEATAFGARMILENFTSHGVWVDEIYACGGISWKNPFLMQLYADVLGLQIRVLQSRQTSALGSAIMGALAAGSGNGGYDDYALAAAQMGGKTDAVYRPDPKAHEIYCRLFNEYRRLHDCFGRGGSDLMKSLKSFRKNACRQDRLQASGKEKM